MYYFASYFFSSDFVLVILNQLCNDLVRYAQIELSSFGYAGKEDTHTSLFLSKTTSIT
jgi:hypothetical protein